VDGSPKLRKVLPRIDAFQSRMDMRHGRKSRSQKFDGYKRHILKDLELQMVRAVGVTKANRPSICNYSH